MDRRIRPAFGLSGLGIEDRRDLAPKSDVAARPAGLVGDLPAAHPDNDNYQQLFTL
jgi:hypothetical protein